MSPAGKLRHRAMPARDTVSAHDAIAIFWGLLKPIQVLRADQVKEDLDRIDANVTAQPPTNPRNSTSLWKNSGSVRAARSLIEIKNPLSV